MPHIAIKPAPTHTSWRLNMPHAEDPVCRLVTDDDDNTMTKPNEINDDTMTKIHQKAGVGFSKRSLLRPLSIPPVRRKTSSCRSRIDGARLDDSTSVTSVPRKSIGYRSEVSDENTQSNSNTNSRHNPESDDHRGLGPSRQLEMVMNGRHPKKTTCSP